ncbi:probable WRKY transcription factor 10, partial [Raphanus sativus]|uniref:Probable WRKY transcription factor 10 n=1 Tax=Raphanus sativus TaxID=3726 RepID=A0A9W3D3C5_RAPSA
MSDYDGNFMDDLSPLSSPNIRGLIAMLDQNNNDRNPISETFLKPTYQLILSLSKDLVVSVRVWLNPILVPSPILVISPGFHSPLLQSPNIFSNSSSQIIPPCPIPNGAPPEMVQISSAGDQTMIIPNNNHPQGGSDNSYKSHITSHDSNACPIGAPLIPSSYSEVVVETDVMNHISLKMVVKKMTWTENITKRKTKLKITTLLLNLHPERKEKMVVSNMMGVTRQNGTDMVIIQVESEEDHPDDGFRWRKYGQKLSQGMQIQ